MTTSSTAEFNVSDVRSKTESVFPFSDVRENTKKRRGVYPVATDAAEAASPEALPCTGETEGASDVHSRCTGVTADVAPRMKPLEIKSLDVSWINFVSEESRASALIAWFLHALSELKREDYDAWDERLGLVVSVYCEATLKALKSCKYGDEISWRVLRILESTQGWDPARKLFPGTCDLVQLHHQFTDLDAELDLKSSNDHLTRQIAYHDWRNEQFRDILELARKEKRRDTEECMQYAMELLDAERGT